MDEEPKPFPIEFIVILMIVAIANDIAEVCFDLLDFTGVGIAGEGIMEPVNFVLDLFFTGIFVWRLGFGGATITQYIDDLLEPLLIPGRAISVGLGMYIANHPQSAVGKVANQAASLENGGGVGELEGAAETAGKSAAEGSRLEGGAQQEGVTSGGGNPPKSQGGQSSASSTQSSGSRSSASGGGGDPNEGGEGVEGGEPIEIYPAKDELASAEEGDPMARVKEGIEGSEAVGFQARPKNASNEDEQSEKVVDIRKPDNKNLTKAA
jgi:hypothetical protein